MAYDIFHGDCLEVLKLLPNSSADSLITDPPAGISFMGKAWDGDKGGRKQWVAWMTEVMTECLRVLKPGASGLVWALPRTSHWTATALEEAGFEVRDVMTHLFGSGFPKSLDVSKAIDKAAGAERQVVGPSARHAGTSKASAPIGDVARYSDAGNFITAPATDDAKTWVGWGTALKPASEHWILVRKPCSEKTVAANVLKWGTGALNIDASRIAGDMSEHVRAKALEKSESVGYGSASWQKKGTPQPQGRFPANLVFSCACEDQHELGCAVGELDRQSGPCPGPWGKDSKGLANGEGSMFKIGGVNSQNEARGKEKASGASRFFYCAKISKAERGEGNTHPTVKPGKLMQYFITMITPPGGLVLDPFTGSGSTGVAAVSKGFAFLGIEQSEEYVAIAEARIAKAS